RPATAPPDLLSAQHQALGTQHWRRPWLLKCAADRGAPVRPRPSFRIKIMRTHSCVELNATLIGEPVTLAGWVHRRRDHGGVIFVDLRDASGLVQVVFDPDTAEAFARAERLRSEWVIAVSGRIRHRPEGTENPDLASGEIEVLAADITVLGAAETPPFVPE